MCPASNVLIQDTISSRAVPLAVGRFKFQECLCSVKNGADGRVVERLQDHFVIGVAVGQQTTSCCRTLAREANKMFTPVGGVAYPSHMPALFQFIYKLHDHILVQSQVSGDLFLGHRLGTVSGQQDPNFTNREVQQAMDCCLGTALNDARALGELQQTRHRECGRQVLGCGFGHFLSADISARWLQPPQAKHLTRNLTPAKDMMNGGDYTVWVE